MSKTKELAKIENNTILVSVLEKDGHYTEEYLITHENKLITKDLDGLLEFIKPFYGKNSFKISYSGDFFLSIERWLATLMDLKHIDKHFLVLKQ